MVHRATPDATVLKVDKKLTTPIYHFTHANNLPKILETGYLYCKNKLPTDAQVVDISFQNVQEKRRNRQVNCGPGGILHDYVPFLFATSSPMMFLISRGGVEGRSKDTTSPIYVVSSVRRVQDEHLSFAFSDGHPIVALSSFYEETADLDKVDWKVMRLKYWQDTDKDSDRERRRQAEFLVHETFPWEAVEYLAVRTPDMKRRLDKYLSEKWPHRIRPVEVRPSWYF